MQSKFGQVLLQQWMQSLLRWRGAHLCRDLVNVVQLVYRGV
jgi:hypothetical protein